MVRRSLVVELKNRLVIPLLGIVDTILYSVEYHAVPYIVYETVPPVALGKILEAPSIIDVTP